MACDDILSFIDSMQEDPVSEKLEEAINAYIGYTPDIDECLSVYGKRQAFKAGAKWKEKEMQSTIELAEDHAMLAGMEKMKEEMMKKAIDGIAHPDDKEIWCDMDKYNLKEGDKVKIIVAREK